MSEYEAAERSRSNINSKVFGLAGPSEGRLPTVSLKKGSFQQDLRCFVTQGCSRISHKCMRSLGVTTEYLASC